MSEIPYTFRDGASPVAASFRVSFIYAAANLYGSALAVASPGGALDAPTCQAIGRDLALRGRSTWLIEVDPDGEYSITRMMAWLNNGRWTGTTHPLSGDLGSTVTAPDGAVLNFRFLDGQAPVSRLNPLGGLAAEIENAALSEAEVPVGRLVGAKDFAAGLTAGQRSDVSRGLRRGNAPAPAGDFPNDPSGRVHVLPAEFDGSRVGALGPNPAPALVSLRAQVRDDTAAAFGIIGLLSEAQDASAHSDWRVATIRAFEPLMLLVEAEAARKLDAPVRFDRRKLIAAPHSETARAVSQRAGAVQRLQAAGMDLDRAVQLAGLDGTL